MLSGGARLALCFLLREALALPPFRAVPVRRLAALAQQPRPVRRSLPAAGRPVLVGARLHGQAAATSSSAAACSGWLLLFKPHLGERPGPLARRSSASRRRGCSGSSAAARRLRRLALDLRLRLVLLAPGLVGGGSRLLLPPARPRQRRPAARGSSTHAARPRRWARLFFVRAACLRRHPLRRAPAPRPGPLARHQMQRPSAAAIRAQPAARSTIASCPAQPGSSPPRPTLRFDVDQPAPAPEHPRRPARVLRRRIRATSARSSQPPTRPLDGAATTLAPHVARRTSSPRTAPRAPPPRAARAGFDLAGPRFAAPRAGGARARLNQCSAAAPTSGQLQVCLLLPLALPAPRAVVCVDCGTFSDNRPITLRARARDLDGAAAAACGSNSHVAPAPARCGFSGTEICTDHRRARARRAHNSPHRLPDQLRLNCGACRRWHRRRHPDAANTIAQVIHATSFRVTTTRSVCVRVPSTMWLNDGRDVAAEVAPLLLERQLGERLHRFSFRCIGAPAL